MCYSRALAIMKFQAYYHCCCHACKCLINNLIFPKRLQASWLNKTFYSFSSACHRLRVHGGVQPGVRIPQTLPGHPRTSEHHRPASPIGNCSQLLGGGHLYSRGLSCGLGQFMIRTDNCCRFGPKCSQRRIAQP